MKTNRSISLRTWFGKRCVATVGRRSVRLLIFDWAALKKRSAFLDDLFGDSEISGSFSRWVGREKKGGILWKHPNEVPFALAEPADEPFVNGAEYPQFHELWITDPSTNGPVFYVEVDGSAVPQKSPRYAAKSRALLKLTPDSTPLQKSKSSSPLDYDEKQGAILAGFRHGGPPLYAAQDLLKKLVKAGVSIDAKWVTAIAQELSIAVLAKDVSSTSLLSEALSAFGNAGHDAINQVLHRVAESPKASDPPSTLKMVLRILFEQKSTMSADAVLLLLESITKTGHELERDLVRYLAYTGTAHHLPRLERLSSLRPIETIDKTIHWISCREKNSKKTFSFGEDPTNTLIV